MSVYHIGLFYLRNVDFSTLYFSLLTFFVAMHLTVGGEFVIKFFFPNINWELLMKINYIGNYLRLGFFALFIWFLFKEDFSKLFMKILIIIGIAMSAFILFTPAWIYTHTFIVFVLILAITFTYLIYSLFRASIKKREGAILSLVGTLILFIAAINDILYTNLIINTGYLIPLGLFLFIFFQSFMLSLRFSKAFGKAEELSSELKVLNINLERRVRERTTEIEQQKEELQAQANNLQDMNEELGSTNELLKLSKSELEQKNIEIDKKNEDITSSIKYAKRLQEAILPSETEFKQLFSDYFIVFKPRDIVSGDFYMLEKVDKYTILAVADCTGHGVPGGFMSMLATTLIHELMRYKDLTKTGEFLDSLRRKVISALKQDANKKVIGDGLDIAFTVIDSDENKLYFSGAYNPLFIFRNDKFIEIKADKMPIGNYIGKTRPFTTKTFDLEKDDQIYLFTDGFKDQYGGKNFRKFLNKNFKKLLFDNRKLPMDKQKQIILETFEKWINPDGKTHKQIDDISIIGIKI